MSEKKLPASCSLLQSQLTKLKKPFVIGVAGDSGSGKTVFSDGIRRILGPDLVHTITMDGYHTQNRAMRTKTGRLPLDPGINDFKRFAHDLSLLKKNKPTTIPIYNHSTGDFGKPIKVNPAPIIIVEGLHALYPEFLQYIDLRIFVDPCRDVKWHWKFARDVKKRGHRAEKLEEEMLAREAAYKRWIDFQKIDADMVIKIFLSRMKEFARYDFTNPLPTQFYKVELIMQPAKVQLPTVTLPFDLSTIMDSKEPPFLLATTSCRYWGKPVVNIHMDGAFSQETIQTLESHITSCTDIAIDYAAAEGEIDDGEGSDIGATQLTQLIVAWRFLEEVNQRLTKEGIKTT